jgi:HNH endonuclease
MKASLRIQVFERALGCCEYCLSQSEFSHDDFSVEHVLPKALGGTDELENLALSCQACNNRKFTAQVAIDPISGESERLYHPRQDVWTEHFRWTTQFSEVVGISPVGRATVQRLELNRPGLVNLRRALHKAGCHPPQYSQNR